MWFQKRYLVLHSYDWLYCCQQSWVFYPFCTSSHIFGAKNIKEYAIFTHLALLDLTVKHHSIRKLLSWGLEKKRLKLYITPQYKIVSFLGASKQNYHSFSKSFLYVYLWSLLILLFIILQRSKWGKLYSPVFFICDKAMSKT